LYDLLLFLLRGHWPYFWTVVISVFICSETALRDKAIKCQTV